MNYQKGYTTNQAFYLLLVIFALSLILLTNLITKIAPLTVSHTVYLCQQMVSNFMITIPHSFPSILVILLILLTLIGLSVLIFKIVVTYFYISQYKKYHIKAPAKIQKIAKQLQITTQVEVISFPGKISFCYGIFKPKICISQLLINTLTTSELKSVLTHEKYHLVNSDPLKILLTQVASSMFFFVPILRDIQSYYSLSKELSADDIAIQSYGVESLRSALRKVLITDDRKMQIAYFSTQSTLEQRINYLINKEKTKLHFKPLSIAVSLIVILTAFMVLRLPVHAMENADSSHSYHVCLFNDSCMTSCRKEEVSQELLFSQQKNYTPIDSSGH